MKKLSQLVLLMFFCFISLSAQIEKKDPLVVINGKITKTKLSSIDIETIESLTVLKNQAAVDEYGILAENGVINIFTKDYVKTDNHEDQPCEKLILVNGEVFTGKLDSINIQEVKNLTIKRDKTYGKIGEKGVILITTNKNTLSKKE